MMISTEGFAKITKQDAGGSDVILFAI